MHRGCTRYAETLRSISDAAGRDAPMPADYTWPMLDVTPRSQQAGVWYLSPLPICLTTL